MKFITQLPLAFLAVLALAACSKKEAPPAPPPPAAASPAPDLVNVPVSVKQVVLAKQIGADKRAAVAVTDFAPADTIYAVVETIGSGKASLKAAWTFHKGDKSAPVSETVQELTLAGPTASEFHISKPGGWPAGDYQVAVSLNGAPAGSQKFSVK